MGASSSSLLMAITMVLLVAVEGAAMAAMPWIARAGECFAVSVPRAALRHPRIVRLRRRYTVAVALLTAVLVAVTVFACLAGDEAAALAASVAAPLLLVAVPFALMLVCRSRVRALKRAEGWRATRQLRAAVVGEAEELPRPLSLAWELVHLPVLALAVGLALALLPGMPERVPIHFDTAGNANGWVERGWQVVALPALLIAFMGACMTFCHVAIVRSKRGVLAEASATSAYGYACFARFESVMLVGIGLAYNLCFAFTPLMMAGAMSVDAFVAAMLAVTAGVLAACVWLYAVYGQNGWRAARRLAERAGAAEGDDALLADDDEHWKLGVIYFNPDDPAVWVPERFGTGWTINAARPAAWACLLGFIALTAVFCLVCGALVS